MPSPSVETGGVAVVQDYLSWYTFAFALGGLLWAIGRMAVAGDFKAGAPGLKMLVNLIVSSAALAAGFTALMQAGDAFAPWIVQRATGDALALDGLITTAVVMSAGLGPALIIAICLFLGAFANVVFMVFRSAMSAILFAFIPTAAAASATEAGNQTFRKMIAWLIACLLFKPVAAVIYALGILLVKSPPAFADTSELGTALYSSALAVVVILSAALALPALVRFVTPVAGAASSSMFSGGAVAGGVVAAGAAVVAIGATGGGAAPAAGGAAATAGGTTGAGTTATGGAATAGGIATGGASTSGAGNASTGAKSSSEGAGQASGASTSSTSTTPGAGTSGGAAAAADPTGGTATGAGATAGNPASGGGGTATGVGNAAALAQMAGSAVAGGARGGPIDDMSNQEDR
ncbi:hypothetical protein [Cellulomonas hominis]|uniref:hypothetical protein n=1 Tax=Cellulomonas hominis TaxID=156981 RepID=UPI001BCCA6AE|nr:hypothetical protein [Cellulomonas hominis]